MEKTNKTLYLLIFIIAIPIYGFWFSMNNVQNLAQFGDFIGGIFGTIITTVSVYYIIKTFRNQSNNEIQKQFDSYYIEFDTFLNSIDASGNLIKEYLISKFESIKSDINKIEDSINNTEYSNEIYDTIESVSNIAENETSINRVFDYYSMFEQFQSNLKSEKEQYQNNLLRLNWINKEIQRYSWLMECINSKNLSLFSSVNNNTVIPLKDNLLFKIKSNLNQQKYFATKEGCLKFVNDCILPIVYKTNVLNLLAVQIYEKELNFNPKVIKKEHLISFKDFQSEIKNKLADDILSYIPYAESSIELNMYVFFLKKLQIWIHINKIEIQSYKDSQFSIHINT